MSFEKAEFELISIIAIVLPLRRAIILSEVLISPRAACF